MAMQELRPFFFRGEWKPVHWHSDDGCFHCAGYMDGTREELEAKLRKVAAAESESEGKA